MATSRYHCIIFPITMLTAFQSSTILSTLILSAFLHVSVASSFAPAPSTTLSRSQYSFRPRSHIFARGGSDGPAQNITNQEEGADDTALYTQDAAKESIQASTSSLSMTVDMTESAKPISSCLLGPDASPPGLLRKTFPNFPWHRIPNILTYVRCIAIPLLVTLFYIPNQEVAVGSLFAVASFTDWLDGYLARRWDITSPFGAFLDPVADKLMVSTSLILLAGRYGMVVAIPTSIILAREIAVSALREWMAQLGQRNLVKVGIQGKLKTAMTMIALTVLLFVPKTGGGLFSALYLPGIVLLYLCALVTLTSGSVYFIAATPYFFGNDS